MAPTPIPITSPSPLGLAILPRTVCYNRHGCGSITVPKDKLPFIISVTVIVVFIVIAVLCCSLRSWGLKKQTPTTWNWLSLGLDANTAPHAVRVPAPTLGAGPTGAGGVIGAGTGTGAGSGAAAGAVTSEGEQPVQPTTTTTTWRVPEGGLPPLVPPPMYEETPPPPTYQRGAGPPVRRGEMAPSYA